MRHADIAGTPRGVNTNAPSPEQERNVWLAGLRHDLRIPLGVIIGTSELLLDEVDPPPSESSRSDLGKIRASARRLLDLVDDLFDPDAFETGRLDARALGSRLRHDLRTPLNHVIGYAEILLEDATDEGAESVARDLERIRSSGRKVLAMLDEALASIAGEGDGGPVAAAAGVPEPELARSLDAFEDDQRAPEPLEGRVLVVDDDETNRDVLARRVRSQGAEVVAVGSGAEALQAVRREEFDAVLLDVLMPGMNGLEVLREMKRDTALARIPVIMISALDQVESTVRCIRLGAEDYLAKPFDATILRARLGASIEKKRMRDREIVHLRTIDEERRRADELLHAIFPAEVVHELKTTRTVLPRRFEDVAVVFSDVVGFTPYAEAHEPEEVVDGLQALVDRQESIAERHGLEKIKTIGDAFMAAAGMLRPTPDPVLACVRAGVEMIDAAGALDPPWNLRIGVHVGPLVGGVLGHRQYLFDLIGDTVNVASRIEGAGEAGSVCLSAAAWERVSHVCAGRTLGRIPVKGRGEIEIVRFDRFL